MIEHPSTKLLQKIEELERKVKLLEIDIVVVRDLLLRTVRMLARLEMEGVKKGPKLFK